MDPLSITAALVSFLTFSGPFASRLRRVISDANHAPDEILALSNEISDLNILLSDLEVASREIENSSPPQPGHNVAHAINSQLGKAKATLVQLQTCASELYDTLPDGSLKFQRYMWIRKKSKVTALLQDLVGIKRSVALMLASATAARTVRIELSLRAMKVGTAGTAVLPTVPDQSAVASFRGMTISGHEPMQEQTGNPSTSIPNDLLSSQLETTEAAGPSYQTGLGHRNGLPSSDWSGDGSLPTFLQMVRQVGQFGSMSFHVNRLARCEGHCDCICHSRSLFTTPKILNKFLGQLFIGYAGLPIWIRNCNNATCTNQYARTMQVSYTFPGWLLMKTVDMAAAMTYNNEPSFGLKVRNRVPSGGATEDTLFTLARNGRTGDIIELFKQRKASPNDLSAGAGQTAIHDITKFAMELGHVETCRFLLSVGVDPYIRDDRGLSDAHEVSQLILSKRGSTRTWDCEAVFSKIACQHAEMWDFSYIHSIVTGVLHVDLESALQKPEHDATFDSPDSYGRSPLFWAAFRGDTESVRLLLRKGASVSRLDGEHKVPLHAAACSGNVRCVETLLMAGSNVHTRDFHGDTAIHIAAWADDNPDLLAPIFLAGASLNGKNKIGSTPLQHAACLNHPRNGEYLLRIGADIECRDNDNNIPLLGAVRYSNTAMVEVLLRHGAKVDNTNNYDQTVLHIAANWANVRTVEVLAEAHLEGLSTESRDCKGRTAWEVFEARAARPDGFDGAFGKLIDHVKRLEAARETDADEEDVFADAVEIHDLVEP